MARIAVTGGGSGIGEATCQSLRDRGDEAIALDLNAGADGVRFDVTDEEAWERVVDELWPLHGLVNCAGIRRRASLVDSTLSEFRATMAVNLDGPFLGMRTVSRRWIAEGTGGVVVNVASLNGVLAHAGQVAYATSKGALIQLTRAAAMELAPHAIRVNAVAPGAVRTPMTLERLDDPDAAAWLDSRIPMGKVADPPDIAATIAFLLSNDARYVTGTTLFVDGGWNASL